MTKHPPQVRHEPNITKIMANHGMTRAHAQVYAGLLRRGYAKLAPTSRDVEELAVLQALYPTVPDVLKSPEVTFWINAPGGPRIVEDYDRVDLTGPVSFGREAALVRLPGAEALALIDIEEGIKKIERGEMMNPLKEEEFYRVTSQLKSNLKDLAQHWLRRLKAVNATDGVGTIDDLKKGRMIADVAARIAG